MSRTFRRDGFTWLAYLFLGFYGYFLNGLGPITPFLKDELPLSYTVSSLHFTADAAGIRAAYGVVLLLLAGIFTIIGLGGGLHAGGESGRAPGAGRGPARPEAR